MLNSSQLIGFGGRRASGPATQSVTFNPSDKSASITLSNGNMDIERAASSGWANARTTLGRSTGLFYFEFMIVTVSTNNLFAGFMTSGASLDAWAVGQTANGGGFRQNLKLVTGWTHANNTATGGTEANNNRWMYALNLNNGKAWSGLNGTWTSGDPSADTTPWITGITGTVYPAAGLFVNGGKMRLIVDSADLLYTPSGFSPWNLA